MSKGPAQKEQDREWKDRLKEMTPSKAADEVGERLETWREEFRGLREQASAKAQEAGEELEARLAVLGATLDQAEEQLRSLRKAPEGEQEESKMTLRSLVIGLRRDLSEVRDRLSDR